MVDGATAADYQRFAAMEAHGRSPLYEQLALGVAADIELLGLLDELPMPKRQPNLLFAATRHVAGTPADFAQFRRDVLDHRDAIVTTMRERRTQTNEPGRCTGLYPVLAALPQPLALLEVGASAGLCLLADRYGYDYDGRLMGDVHSRVRMRCRVEGSPRLAEPGTVTVAWRAGIDLNPLDVTDPNDVRWLQTLVWPEHHDRLARLNAAIAVAREDPPRVVRGDLNACLGELAALAPRDATLVVFHTAVLDYVPEPGRTAFVEHVDRLSGHWLSQEGAAVVPGIAARLREAPSTRTATYVLALDGLPIAFTAMHGGWLRWLAPG